MTGTMAALWLLNLLLDTVGQLAFKRAASEPDEAVAASQWRAMLSGPWVWIGIGCYCLEFFSWLAFLTLMPLSVAVLLASANILTVALGGWLLFQEYPNRMRICGMALVATGVLLVGAG